jgi:undecaprenyl-diphosphatase
MCFKAQNEFLHPMNNTIFLFFFHLSRYVVIRDVALFLSYPMKFIVPCGLVIWIMWNVQRKWYTFFLLFCSAFFTWLVTAALKISFMIPRPYVTLNLTPLFNESSYSFPSNHAAFFAALALASFSVNKTVGRIVAVCALLIGLSRMVIGVHTPLDVFAGFCVGIIISFICVKIFTYKKS